MPGSRSSPGSASRCCPTRETVLQDGDIVHVLLMREDEERIQEIFQAAPEGHR